MKWSDKSTHIRFHWILWNHHGEAFGHARVQGVLLPPTEATSDTAPTK
jgi:hypothetical protein